MPKYKHYLFVYFIFISSQIFFFYGNKIHQRRQFLEMMYDFMNNIKNYLKSILNLDL